MKKIHILKSLHMLNLCNESYKEYNIIKHNLSNIGYSNIKLFDKNGAQAVCMTDSNNIVHIVFRGAQFNGNFEWNDLKASFKVSSYTVDNKRVHKGYYQYYLKLQNQIKEYIEEYNTDDNTLLITGFSLGGAMALHLAYEYPNSVTYVFGTPKSMSKDFKNIDREIYNFTTDVDVLSEVPFGINKFIHFGERLTLKTDGEIIKKSKKKLAFYFLFLIILIPVMPLLLIFNIKSFVFQYFFNQHSSYKYIERIENVISRIYKRQL